MEDEIKKVISQWLEIDFLAVANKLEFIKDTKLADEDLIYRTIRCLDSITIKRDEKDVNLVIALIALMWTYADKEIYDLKDIIIKFLSRIGYPTSAIIVDEEFDKKECRFAALNSWLDELTVGSNQLLNEVEVNGHTFMLTDFQKKIWTAMESNRVVGISAPTSAGKSFVILLKILQNLSVQSKDVVYIVPTLSLVNQVTEDFNTMLKELGIDKYKISNAFAQKDDLDVSNIYVLTQEKALAAFSNEETAFSKKLILVTDEIQNIERMEEEQDERSKILFDVLTEFRYKENVEQFIIAGPRIEEIGELGNNIFGVDAENISTESSPVFNLTYSISSRDSQYYFKQYCSLTHDPICKLIENPSRISGYGKKKYDNQYLEYLSVFLDSVGRNQQNIIFSPTAPMARKIACYLAKGDEHNQTNEELIKYFSHTVHEEYSLCKTLRGGIAYHHGKLPMHVRRTLEKAIVDKKIMNVVCTTTLMQGVNMPAQNVIIRNPHLYLRKDTNTSELSNYEMANLRGRAGRLLKDFIGRTYVLDESAFSSTEGYEQMELFNDETKELPSGYEEKFEKHKRNIEKIVSSSRPVDETMHSYGYLVSYIRQAVLRYGLNAKTRLKNVGITLSSRQIKITQSELESLTVPKEVCMKNRYWDPYVLQKIFEGYEEQVPITPNEKGARAKIDRMLKFMRDTPETASMYNRHIPPRLRKKQGRGYLVDLCMKWSKGITLHEILSKIKNDNNKDDEIEDVINILQNTVSYHVPLLLKPIFDIKNPDSSYLTCLQTGASQPIIKKMIEIGIPRETAVELFQQLYDGKKGKELEEVDEKQIRETILHNYDDFSYWIRVQLDFLK